MKTDLTLIYEKIFFSPAVKKCSRFQIKDKKKERESKSHYSLQPSLQIMMGLAGGE